MKILLPSRSKMLMCDEVLTVDPICCLSHASFVLLPTNCAGTCETHVLLHSGNKNIPIRCNFRSEKYSPTCDFSKRWRSITLIMILLKSSPTHYNPYPYFQLAHSSCFDPTWCGKHQWKGGRRWKQLFERDYPAENMKRVNRRERPQANGLALSVTMTMQLVKNDSARVTKLYHMRWVDWKR